jgi:lipopolysaccharide biosynthesis glycosyltransferase
MYSLLDRMSPTVRETRFTIFSEALNTADITLLRRTLEATTKPFTLELRRVDESAFAGFPSLYGSWATYYRLFAVQMMAAERFLYVDADTLCDVDVSELESLEMAQAPVGWVPEAPLKRAVDRGVSQQLGNREGEFYFNAGVLLVNVAEWRRQNLTERAMDYIAAQRPAFHDQSALNYLLCGKAFVLDHKFNCRSNVREYWPCFKPPYRGMGRLIHFVDYPKPWDWMGEFVHPQYGLWRSVLDKTALKHFRGWRGALPWNIPQSKKAWIGYKKAIKDRLLFAGYSRGWLKRVKGIPL